MMTVRMVTAADWRALREIRLTALRDTPQAFGSTYDREVRFPDEEWQRRAGGGSTFFACLGEVPVGTATGLLAGPGVAELVGMFVSPAGTRHGRGRGADRRGRRMGRHRS